MKQCSVRSYAGKTIAIFEREYLPYRYPVWFCSRTERETRLKQLIPRWASIAVSYLSSLKPGNRGCRELQLPQANIPTSIPIKNSQNIISRESHIPTEIMRSYLCLPPNGGRIFNLRAARLSYSVIVPPYACTVSR